MVNTQPPLWKVGTWEAACTVRIRCWRNCQHCSNEVLEKLALYKSSKTAHWETPTCNIFPTLLLTKLNISPAGKSKIFNGLIYIFAEQVMKCGFGAKRQYTSMFNCWFWYMKSILHITLESHSVNQNGVECSFGYVPSWTETVGPLYPSIDLSLDIAVQEVSKLRQCLAYNRVLEKYVLNVYYY